MKTGRKVKIRKIDLVILNYMRNIKVIERNLESWLNVQKANLSQKNLINVMVIVRRHGNSSMN